MAVSSVIRIVLAGAFLSAAVPGAASAQERYFARQNLSGFGAKATASEPTYTCAVPEQGYIASYNGGLSPAFYATSPSDAQAKCNASRPPSPTTVLNMCVYSTTADAYGSGKNAIAIWQDPSNTDHTRSYDARFKSFYSSNCTRN